MHAGMRERRNGKAGCSLDQNDRGKNEKAFYLNLSSYLADTSMKIRHEV